ncbi:ABC-type sugar transport system, substrate-binding protein, contains N-terminal xre family HTH domain [Ruminococcus sp. YE71]|uniref:substrate-binding domain-containing protein n=1 Tax=unclassified Ruminococcus TaxID=2608920 RepID=UPI0008884F9F|nr:MULTISPECIES: substrate-binding domain-containing protein [unclassified Ruminococcus]SDA22113.1 ABC-type sugar transport system, substrate-binding protein, contains N-terminal xre family HTH domain [Ruminococcus sp. YE78]SFW37473.1 ABC-type sugar transport system, substrate-binding protein, contains N-terminal xre family HTH domain [Ruminococcus sp. YE71]
MNRKTGSILKRMLAVSLALTTATSFGGCGKKEEAENNGKIAVICKAQGVSFWDYVKMGAEDAGEEIGYDIIYNCAAQESSIDEQIGFINQAISEGVKAIIVAPNSTTELNTALKKASGQGIKIITINSDVKDFNDRLSCIASDNLSCGNIAARQIATILSNRTDFENGTIGIVGHGEKSSTALERIEGFDTEFVSVLFNTWKNVKVKAMSEDAFQEAYKDTALADAYDNGIPSGDPTKYAAFKSQVLQESGLKIAEPVHCDNDREIAKQKAAELISKNSDLVVLYGTNTNSTLGICDAVNEAGKKGKILVVGFNSDTAEIEYLKNGTISGLIVQSPYNMGYLGVRYADKALRDENVYESIDSGATYVTMQNIEETDVKLLLDPRSAL